MAMMVPSDGPLKPAYLQGKSPWGPGSAPFGGSNGLVCLCSPQAVLPQRGMALAPTTTAELSGGVPAGLRQAEKAQARRVAVDDVERLLTNRSGRTEHGDVDRDPGHRMWNIVT